LKLAAAGDEGPRVDIMEISKPDDLGNIANLGLTLTEAKQLLARVQREISTAQAREHAVRRPVCPCRDGICRVKDYRDHAVATLFGRFCRKFPQWMSGTQEVRLVYSASEWNRWAGQSSPVSSNWPFRITCISSIPVSVTAADQKDLNPSIGRTNRLMAR
jgi:hypothetical protein